ncbi:MAG: head-tail adaptor protein [Candidatus Sulfotelmatobacter sp.]
MLDALELASIRADAANAALDLPCTIQRKTLTRDGAGQATSVWNTVATVNAGMTEPTGGQLQNYNYLIEDLASWAVKLPYGTDVAAQDRLLITGQLGQQTLVVQVVLEPRSYAALLTVIASEAKQK